MHNAIQGERKKTLKKDANTPFNISYMRRLLKMGKIYPDNNCAGLETLIKVINYKLNSQNREVIEKFVFNNLDVFAMHKFGIVKVSYY